MASTPSTLDVSAPPRVRARAPAHDGPRPATRAALAFAFLGLLALILVLPHGEMARNGFFVVDADTGERTWVRQAEGQTRALRTLGAILGQLSTLALVAGLVLARDWPLVRRLGAPRRARIHRRLGVTVLALAAGHTFLLLLHGDLRGWLPGMLALVALVVHGAANALRAALLQAWGAGWWRYVHRASAWAALILTAEHILMASWHFGMARYFEMSGWGH